ncbi:MAG: DUF6325 family protein [Acidimicrobiia bacterium]|nr:DUF6325 family protein [Acidimicrobiia bacterium]
MTDETLPGPIDFVLVEFPPDASTDATAQATAALVEQGTIRLYDIALLRKEADGRTLVLDLAGEGGGFATFAGAQSGLFDDEDVREAGNAMEADTTALLLAYENTWAGPFVNAAHGAGGRMIASQRIPAQVLLDALDALETAG